MSQTMTALILGPTGSVGSQVLYQTLISPQYTSVIALSRRDPNLPASISDEQKGKLKVENVDYEKLDEEKLKGLGADSVLVALGTTRAAAGGAKQFERIDRDYVINGAKAALTGKPNQRLVYCSSTGANASSPFLYMKSKGLTERGLAKLEYSETIIFRPGFLRVEGGREKPRALESAYGVFTHHVLSRFSSEAEIPTPTLGKAMTVASIIGIEGLKREGLGKEVDLGEEAKAWIIGNGDAIKLAEVKI